MTSLNLSASAPNILNENESEKLIGKRKDSIKISFVKNNSKKSDIASIAEAEDFALTDYEDSHIAENVSLPNTESFKHLVGYTVNDSSNISQNEKNSR